ncbi:hypothetical protein [Caenispirillum bisanense]|uniref:Uncharacterized protein n=1 Tax=Caenispirillum bisanense TaxID=414052 RepID=A0A286GP26_9PROT|nr:hypothetical protein [Caenispirillum bisanense]SOD97278.1 hypothetical protein SAMN05421508_106362 [Caenispirillum bisanense]
MVSAGSGRVAYAHLVDGCAALQVAIDALVTGRLPPDYEGPAGAADLARHAFRQAVIDTHNDFRLYMHVLASMTLE